MQVEERIRLCRLIEKMDAQEAYSRKLGLENVSRFQGQPAANRKKKEEMNHGKS